MSYKELTPEEAAALIEHGENIGFSGFTAAGVPKAVPRAIAARATAEHEAGRPFKVNIFTGASTSASADGALAEADAVDCRTPYQSSPALRKTSTAAAPATTTCTCPTRPCTCATAISPP